MSRFHAQLSSRGGGQSYRGRNASSSSSSCHVTRHRPSSSSSSRSTRIRAIGVDTDIALSAKSVNANSALGEVKVDPRTCISIILGGGAGTRLYPLTKSRAKPAVPIGGAYRLIDVPMSNCLNSGLSKIYILTQFNSTSLNRHLSRTYNFGQGPGNGGDGFVEGRGEGGSDSTCGGDGGEVLAASQTPDSKDWFGGTADAVRQYSWVLADIKNRDIDDIMILSGDHLYRMDYTEFLETHKKTDADITVGALPCDETRASSFGLMKINGSGQIVEFAEKPEGEALEKMQVDTTVLGLSPREAAKAPYIASMGIYIFKKDVLLNLLNASHAAAMDFGSEIIPKAAMDHKVQAHLFEGYWEDIGTIRSFFDANLALTEVPAKFEFYNAENPIYTAQRFLPPAKIQDCKISDSIISHGCYLESCKVEHAIVGLRSHICKGAVLKDAMVMGADYFETEEERQRILSSGDIPLGVGENSVLQNCILDKNARIGKDCIIINKEGVDELNKEEEGYIIRSGIVVICRGAKIPDGTVI